MEKGLIHIYCGDGKGKTTAAMGLLLRCCGQGGTALLARFFKSGEGGELSAARERFGDEVHIVEGFDIDGFLSDMDNEEKKSALNSQRDKFFESVRRLKEGSYDIAIFDEALSLVHSGAVSTREICEFLEGHTAKTEIVLTGREPGPEIIKIADYVSKIECIKHPYTRGVPPRRGIEI